MGKKMLILGVFSLFIIFAPTAGAANVLPRFAKKTVSKSTYVPQGVVVSARLRPDRKALNLYISNLQKATSVFYSLTYQTSEKEEGIGGSIDSSQGNSISRELLFGTCSSGVCRYHSGISNMKLEVTSELTSGKKTVKRFKIRI